MFSCSISLDKLSKKGTKVRTTLHRYALARNKCESDRIDEIDKISPVPDLWAEDIDLTLITAAFLKRKLLVQ